MAAVEPYSPPLIVRGNTPSGRTDTYIMQIAPHLPPRPVAGAARPNAQRVKPAPTSSGRVVNERKALSVTGASGRSPTTTASTGPASVLSVRMPPTKPLSVANFDWDDNIFQMPTQNWIFHKETGAPLGFGTVEWPAARPFVGQAGDYQDYAVTDQSFAEFFDAAHGNKFLADVEAALTGPSTTWQGPSWQAFVKACSTCEGAKRTTIITARGHSPETIHAALLALVDKGLIRHAPSVEHVFPVAYPPLAERVGATPLEPSGGKAKVMIELLDRLQASVDGPVSWGFSDDDHKNFAKAKDVLEPLVAAGRWPSINITLHYTGVHHPGVAPHALALD